MIFLLGSLAPLAWLFSSGAADEPMVDPLPLRRVLLPAERLPAELARVQQGVLVKLPRAEFEARVRQAARAGEALKSPPRLVESRYSAALAEDSFLVGNGQWKIINPSSGPNFLRVDPLNLAVQKARLQKAQSSDTTDALLGDLDGKRLGLLVEHAGEQTALLDWTARGDLRPEALRFSLQVPPCAVAVLELNLPADRVVAPRDNYLLSGPFPAEALDRRLWRVDFSGRSQVDLEIRPSPEPGQPPVLLAWVQTQQNLEPDLVRATFEFNLEVPRQSVRELHFEADPVLRPYDVTAANLDSWEPQASTGPGAPSSLVVRLSDPFQGGVVRIRCLAPLQAGGTWHCPGLRLVGAVPRGEDLVVRVHPQVSLENWQPGDFRITRPPGPEAASDPAKTDGWLVFGLTANLSEAVAGPRRPRAVLKIVGPSYRVRQLSWWQISPDASTLTTQLSYDIDRGQLFRLPLRLPADWEVGSVELSPLNLLRNWTVSSDQGQRLLLVDLQRPLSPAPAGGPAAPPARLRVQLRTRRPAAGSGPT
ncbi:MAG: hypothetical protein JO112_02300, partial [Planctomycetes bacterium]|nr:hypothetical protein [Planctomycetota bacterium]